jgi:hypothetical protein
VGAQSAPPYGRLGEGIDDALHPENIMSRNFWMTFAFFLRK